MSLYKIRNKEPIDVDKILHFMFLDRVALKSFLTDEADSHIVELISIPDDLWLYLESSILKSEAFLPLNQDEPIELTQ